MKDTFISSLKAIITRKRKKFIAICLVVLSAIVISRMKTSPARQHQADIVEYKDPGIEANQQADWLTYKSAKYNYQISYPINWHIFTGDAEGDFADTDLGDGQNTKEGGAVFWSNRDNIDYTQDNKPDDFRLLGLIIYEKPNTDLDGLARLLGFTDNAGTTSLVFKAKNLTGKEYISPGASDDQPRAAIIFKNGDRFYVFHLGFIGGDKEALKTMEEIVGSFKME